MFLSRSSNSSELLIDERTKLGLSMFFMASFPQQGKGAPKIGKHNRAGIVRGRLEGVSCGEELVLCHVWRRPYSHNCALGRIWRANVHCSVSRDYDHVGEGKATPIEPQHLLNFSCKFVEVEPLTKCLENYDKILLTFLLCSVIRTVQKRTIVRCVTFILLLLILSTRVPQIAGIYF